MFEVFLDTSSAVNFLLRRCTTHECKGTDMQVAITAIKIAYENECFGLGQILCPILCSFYVSDCDLLFRNALFKAMLKSISEIAHDDGPLLEISHEEKIYELCTRYNMYTCVERRGYIISKRGKQLGFAFDITRCLYCADGE
jgi:hypothetical protein